MDQNANALKIRLRFLAERLHALGEKPLWHFLTDIEGGKPFRPTLEEYATLPADFIKSNGGDEFLSPFSIEGGRE
jgi:hypothetical protein